MHIEVPVNNVADWIEIWTDTNGIETDWREELKRAAEADRETGHHIADAVLCELLIELGFDEVVDAWRKIPKWYA